jgi:hypothetical protein
MKFGTSNIKDLEAATPPAWVHCCDPNYVADLETSNAQEAIAPCANINSHPTTVNCEPV